MNKKRNIPFIPDEQTLLIVVQITDVGIPAPNAACLAGACPKFALRTFPKNTSCTSDGSTLALLRAAAKLFVNLDPLLDQRTGVYPNKLFL